MALTRFPSEFEALLTARGRRLLTRKAAPGVGALSRERFFSSAALIKPEWARAGAAILASAFGDLLIENTLALPPATEALLPNHDRLPKVGRMQSVPSSRGAMENSVQFQRGVACGVVDMLRSPGFFAFVEALAGRSVEGPNTLQAFCYRPGDYAGPHTDHHPEEERILAGYIDVHLTFCTPGVSEQLIVYERDGHLTEQRSLARSGVVSAYRLPFWHYTTPLQASRSSARRWLVLTTFLDAVSPPAATAAGESTPGT